tara:strand:- start:3465 stop:3569 length:105 start_codon:yes stop_codon:yes gene_type:complete
MKITTKNINVSLQGKVVNKNITTKTSVKLKIIKT